MEGVSLNTNSYSPATATHHWYDSIVSVVNTIVCRLQVMEWATGYRSQFSANLKGAAGPTPAEDYSDYTTAALQLIDAGHQISETAVRTYLKAPRIGEGLYTPSLSNEDQKRLKDLGILTEENSRQRWKPRSYVLFESFMQTDLSHRLAVAESPSQFVKKQLEIYWERAIEQAEAEAKKKGDEVDEPLLFFPVVLESGHPLINSRHIVWVTLDYQKEEIEYYDPRGLPIEGTAAEHVVEGIRLYFKDDRTYPLVQNHYRHQFDTHNCGIFGLAYAEARIQGRSFRGIARCPNPDIEKVRREMAQHMKDQANENVQKNQANENGQNRRSQTVTDEGFVEL